LRRRCPGILLEVVQPEHLTVLGQRVDGRLLLPDPLGGRPERVAQFALEASAADATVYRRRPSIGRPVLSGPVRRRRRAVRPALLLPLLIRHQLLSGRSVHHFLTARTRVYLWHAHVPDVIHLCAAVTSRDHVGRWSVAGGGGRVGS